jgi:hypothetical protein
MSVKFRCATCGLGLSAPAEKTGKNGKCPRCGHAMTVPSSPMTTAAASPGSRKSWLRRALVATAAAAVLAGCVVLAAVLYARSHEVDRALSDLGADARDVRGSALLRLAEADPQDARRADVTAKLERYLFEGDARGDLDADLLLRAYLRWANDDNVPSMIRMVDNPILPGWTPAKTGAVMEALGRLGDARAADALARKLPDPRLHEQAVDALGVLGRGAEGAVLDYLFDSDPTTRERAGGLLAGYGTDPARVTAAALTRLRSNDPDDRRAAAEWFADNPPGDGADRAAVAAPLTGLLGELSPEVDGLALRGLRSWATRDSVPALVEFARRQDKAGDGAAAAANRSALIDVLARFPDEAAAGAIARRLKDPASRGKAAQALLKPGPVAAGPVLRYIDDPDPDVRKEARSLCRGLNVSADRQIEQTLADVRDPHKPRARVALQHLAHLRPDAGSRFQVSAALNAPLLDQDAGIRADALSAVRIWATKDNAPALIKLLGEVCAPRAPDGQRMADTVGAALIAIGPEAEGAVVPLLKSPEGLVRWEACTVLGEIGTGKSVQPLEDAGRDWLRTDPAFYGRTQVVIAKIATRQ